MWTLEKEPRRRRGAGRSLAPGSGRSPVPGAGGERGDPAGGEARWDRARAEAWAASPGDGAGWRDVEKVVFRRAGLAGEDGRAAGPAGNGGGPVGGAGDGSPGRAWPREEVGNEPGPGRSGWLAGARVPVRTSEFLSIDVVGVREPLLTHVRSALLAAGLAERAFPDAASYLDARETERTDRRSGRARASGPDPQANPVLWSVAEPGPPQDAVLVGADGEEAWALGARHPGSQLVTLPTGATWLGARWGTRSRRGVVLAVGGLGGTGGSQRAALALARAAETHGRSVVLVDADAASASRWEAEPGAPGWEAARRWAVDGSVAGLPRLLTKDGGIARLGWGSDEDPARVGPEDVEAVCGALAQSFEMVILSVGALEWPLRRIPGGAAHVLACASGAGGWPRHRCVGASVSIVVLRGRGQSPDGPELAELTGAAWAGSAPDPAGPEPGRALLRLAQRLWLPRLLAGLPPGSA